MTGSRRRTPVPAYRLTPDEMAAAAARIGCALIVPHVTSSFTWLWDGREPVVMLTNNSTDARWFHALAGQAAAVCLIRGRLHWKSTLQGQWAFYFGHGADAFTAEFSRFGVVGWPWPGEEAARSRR